MNLSLLRLLQKLRHLWWLIRKPEITGCMALVRDRNDRILLVRNSYQDSDRWYFPSGGIARNETALQAIIREVRDGTSCELGRIDYLGLDIGVLQHAGNPVHLFTGVTEGKPVANGRQLLEARFFDLAALPQDLGWLVADRVELLREHLQKPKKVYSAGASPQPTLPGQTRD